MNAFLFLYPIEEYLDFTLRFSAPLFLSSICPADEYAAMGAAISSARSPDEIAALQKKNRDRAYVLARPYILNAFASAIDARYRQDGFSISYCVFADRPIVPDFP